MCDFSGRLVAWMDGELAENDAAVAERHVRECAECRTRVASYEAVSRDFVAYYNAALPTALSATPPRRLSRWLSVAAASAVAAALVLLALLPRSAKPLPPLPQMAVAAPPSIEKTAGKPLPPTHRTHVAVRRKAPNANWTMAGPAIQIAIPADAMFPPGAVAEGVTYVANLSLADGSVQGIRPQP
jgi:anti-sigma factor RsiW